MNRKIFFVVSVLSLLLYTGCTKDTGCKPMPVDSEKAEIEAFNSSIGMNATLHSTGLFYEIITPGSTNKPVASSTVYVKYKGTFFNGVVFDQQTNPGLTGFLLNNLIEGWKIGIPLIGKGGKIKLTVPSALAYSCQGESRGAVAIDPNTPLYFEIELVDFL
jgi:FKBP-type peptidyl-prolyl cis-trans isomerase FkpA